MKSYNKFEAITADFSPSQDEILEKDVKFNIGDVDSYRFCKSDEISLPNSLSDAMFSCFSPAVEKFTIGKFYTENCSLVDGKIECKSKDPGKHIRTIGVVNRDIEFFARNVDYYFDLQDSRSEKIGKSPGDTSSLPIFQYHRREGGSGIITPLPAYHSYPSWNIPTIEDDVRFEDKLPIAFWRGTLTGFAEDGRRFRDIMRNSGALLEDKIKQLNESNRFLLVREFKDDEEVDAKIVVETKDDYNIDIVRDMAAIFGSRVSKREHFNFKYLVALDGYDGPSNWYWMLKTNSLVIRQSSNWLLYGDDFFQPWIHFVPIARDLSDFKEVIKWCKDNEFKCKAIIQNAHAAWDVLFNASFELSRRRALFAALNRLWDV
jgi:hypothetical protein